MKRNCKKLVLLSILCCLMVIGGFANGEKISAQSGLYLPSTSQTFGSAKASGSFTVSGSGTWSAVSTCSWIRLTNSSGNGYGIVRFDMLENTSTTSSRSGQILVTCSSGIVGFYTVTQLKFVEQLTLSESSVTVPYGSINSKGGYDSANGSMTFTSNCNWTATCSSWIHLAATSGTRADNGKSMTFTADANTTDTSRSGFIKLTTPTGIMKTCTVTQEKTQYIKIVTEACGAVPDNRSQIYLEFYTSKKWSIIKDGSFVSFSQTSGGPGVYSVEITINENNTYDTRICNYSLALMEVGIVKNYTIIQTSSSIPAIQLERNWYDASYNGGRILIPFYAQTSWNIITNGYVSVDQESGESGYAYITATLEPNDTKMNRLSYIYIIAANQTYLISINQAG